MSSQSVLCLLCAAGLIACQSTPETQTESAKPISSPESQPAVSSTNPLAPSARAFRAGDGASFAEHYAAHAVMVLSNGAVLPASALEAAAKKSGPSVQAWETSDLVAHQVKQGKYLRGKYLTRLKTPDAQVIELRGQRLVSLTGETRIQADVSIPSTEAPMPPELASRATEYPKVGKNMEAQRALFAPGALIILSDGAAYHGPRLQELFQLNGSDQVSGASVTPKRSWVAGEDAFFLESTYQLTFHPAPGQSIPLKGCRLEVWKKLEGTWKIAVQISQPDGSPACLSASK